MPFFDKNGEPIIAPMALLYEPPRYPQMEPTGVGSLLAIVFPDGSRRVLGWLMWRGRPAREVAYYRHPDVFPEEIAEWQYANAPLERLRAGAADGVPLQEVVSDIFNTLPFDVPVLDWDAADIGAWYASEEALHRHD